jgi:hypothetical protein
MRKARPSCEVSLFDSVRAEGRRVADEAKDISRQQDRRAHEHADAQHLSHGRAHSTR